MIRITCISYIVLSLFFNRCTISEIQSVKEKNEEFNSFYHRFYTDSTFQLQRIIFPLPGYNSDSDIELPDDVAEELGIKKPEVFYWKKDEWLFITSFSDENNNIQKAINKSDTLVTEELSIPHTGFRITRKYNLIKGKWYLMYYFYQNI